MNTGFTERSPNTSSSIQHDDRDPLTVNLLDQQHFRTARETVNPPSMLHQPPLAGPTMYQVQYQRAPVHPGHHYMAPSQQAPSLQQPVQLHSSHQLHSQAQQTQVENQQQLQRSTTQGGFSVPRSVTSASWPSNPSVHLHITPTNNNSGLPSAPLSSSSSGSLISYWDQSTTSDSELPAGMTDSHHMEMHGRYPSGATSLQAISPTGAPGQAYPSYATGSDYRVAPSHYPSHPSNGGMPYASNTQSSGFVYPSSSSTSLAPSGYEGYPPLASSQQYVSYLPSTERLYASNPFEIKHRRRTTKSQFRVLESTFRDIPKPNAALRKQISAQLDMPVRAVQIWFQNRRAKAKAMEKKNPASQGQDLGAGETGVQERRYPGDEARRMEFPPLRMSNDARQENIYSATTGPPLPSIAGTSLRERRGIPAAPVGPYAQPQQAEYGGVARAEEQGGLSAGMPRPYGARDGQGGGVAGGRMFDERNRFRSTAS